MTFSEKVRHKILKHGLMLIDRKLFKTDGMRCAQSCLLLWLYNYNISFCMYKYLRNCFWISDWARELFRKANKIMISERYEVGSYEFYDRKRRAV